MSEHQVFLPIASSYTPPRLPLGFGIAHYQTPEWLAHTLKTLNPACWQNWLWNHMGDSTYIPTVFSMRTGTVINGQAADAARNTSRIWALGNEPEQRLSRVSPEMAAEFSREWQLSVGDNFAAPGVIWREGGIEWLKRYLGADGRLGKMLNVHFYGAINADHYTEIWEDCKTQMAVLGITRPVWVTETNAQVDCDHFAVMTRIAELLRRDPLFKMALWYSDWDWWGHHPPDLRTEAGELTRLGAHFLELTQ